MQTPQYDASLLQSVGEDVFINADVEFRRPKLISVGSHAAIDKGVVITTAAKIGSYVHMAPYTTVVGGPTGMFIMEDFATFSAGCRVIVVSNEHMGKGLVGPTIPKQYQDKNVGGLVTMKRFVNLGTNVVIYPGVTLAEGTYAAVGSVLTKDTLPWTKYRGVPAEPYGERPRETLLRYAKELGY